MPLCLDHEASSVGKFWIRKRKLLDGRGIEVKRQPSVEGHQSRLFGCAEFDNYEGLGALSHLVSQGEDSAPAVEFIETLKVPLCS